MSNEIIRISNIAKQHQVVDTVMYALSKENLINSAKSIAGNKAIGIDNITKAEYIEKLDENVDNLINRMKRMAYRPKPVRRVYIPKLGSNNKRPLGIPAFEDKMVQDIMAQILNAIYDPMFKKFSFGFRPGKSCHQAIAYLDQMLHRQKVNYIVDMDIKGFFDNINHEHLIKFLEYRIGDRTFIRYIKRFLICGILEQGKVQKSEKGTPQGGLVSPILGNIYLHFVLDDWFEKKVEKQTRGYAGMVRYADDSVACFQYKEEAEAYLRSVEKRLNKFGLELSMEKTKIIEFGRFANRNRKQKGEKKPETFDFLGFTHYCSLGVKGNFRVKRKTSRKRMKSKIQETKQWLKKRMHNKVSDTIKQLNIKLLGYYRYYGITDNTYAIRGFYNKVCSMFYKTLNRRTQKNKYNYKEYYEKIQTQILRPSIYVDIVKLAYSM